MSINQHRFSSGGVTHHEDIADLLRHQIADLAAHLDRRHHTPPGVALRGLYFWCWPPEICGVPTLLALLDDAVAFVLCDASEAAA